MRWSTLCHKKRQVVQQVESYKNPTELQGKPQDKKRGLISAGLNPADGFGPKTTK